MLENFTVLLYRYPALFRELGTAFYKVGGFGLIAGALAQVGKLAASTATGLARQPPVTDIALLLPGVWTWWIPETFAGVAVYVAAACLGAALAVASKDAQRHLRAGANAF
jgi:hypothetical protein